MLLWIYRISWMIWSQSWVVTLKTVCWPYLSQPHCLMPNAWDVQWGWDTFFYSILCVDISVMKPWIKMIPVKWYDIISLHRFELSNQIDCNNILLDQLGCTLYFSWRLASNLTGRIPSQCYQRFLVLQLMVAWFFVSM